MKAFKTMGRIARLEWNILFYSPVAWLLLILFIIQSGLIFTDILEVIIRYYQPPSSAINLTEKIFTSQKPNELTLLPAVEGFLYLYIPLLSMGLISREVSSGSMKLLQSSPVASWQIVIGKYLAIMLYGLVMMLVPVLYMVAAACAIRSMDLSLVLSGIIGLFLMVCSYAAVGLFMSSLSAYQAVSAISTLAVLAFLNYIDEISDKVHFLRGIGYYFRMKSRTGQFIDGMISTKNSCYFIIMIVLFLGLTILRLDGRVYSGSSVRKTMRYGLFISVCLFAGWLTSLRALTGYLDMTANKTQTLSANVLSIVRQLKGPLHIQTYTNIMGPYRKDGVPEHRGRDEDLFEKYQRFMGEIQFDYTYYYDSSEEKRWYRELPDMTNRQIASRLARKDALDLKKVLSPDELHKKIDLDKEAHQFVRLLQYGNRSTFLRVFEISTSYKERSEMPSENEVAAAMKRLLVQPPKVAFLTGNGERRVDKRGDKGYFHGSIQVDCRGSLINRGFDVLSVDLNKEAVPSDLTGLVIADPDIAFSPGQMARLFNYVDSGGNLLIAGEPGRQAILNPLLHHLHVHMLEGQLSGQGAADAPDFILTSFTPGAARVSHLLLDYRHDSDMVDLPGAAALQYEDNKDFSIWPMLVTDSLHTWNGREEGMKKAYPAALALTRNIGRHEQRIMVVGDADFFTEKEIERTHYGKIRIRDLEFVAAIFSWFAHGEFPVDADHADIHHSYRIGLWGAAFIRSIFLFILPGLLLSIGAIFLLVRKRR